MKSKSVKATNENTSSNNVKTITVDNASILKTKTVYVLEKSDLDDLMIALVNYVELKEDITKGNLAIKKFSIDITYELNGEVNMRQSYGASSNKDAWRRPAL
jgi:hypothetical protein